MGVATTKMTIIAAGSGPAKWGEPIAVLVAVLGKTQSRGRFRRHFVQDQDVTRQPCERLTGTVSGTVSCQANVIWAEHTTRATFSWNGAERASTRPQTWPRLAERPDKAAGTANVEGACPD